MKLYAVCLPNVTSEMVAQTLWDGFGDPSPHLKEIYILVDTRSSAENWLRQLKNKNNNSPYVIKEFILSVNFIE